MPLTVLNVAFPLAPVGSGCVGGAEAVLTALDGALVRAGHRSLVLACEGSRATGELVPAPRWPGTLDTGAWLHTHQRYREILADLLARRPVDVLHFHGLDFIDYLPPWRPPAGPPALATLHLPISTYSERALFPRRPGTVLNCVSDHQRRDLPEGAPLLGVIENGVDLDAFRPGPAKEGFALALGRICSEKGFDLALDAARRAGARLMLAGHVFPFEEHQRHFVEEIEPRLDADRCFVGPVGGEEKRALLAAARCLLVPSRVAETSSLVAREALACGTPVVAFRRGALSEVVEHGRTGFLVDSVEEMAEAIAACARLDPADCRRVAEERFSLDPTTAAYLRLYERLAESGGALEGVATPLDPLEVGREADRGTGRL